MRTALIVGFLEIISCISSVFADEPITFNQVIAPLLKRHCVKCHGPIQHEANLNLSTTSGLIRGGKTGAAVVSHDVDASPIWQRIVSDEMPPDSPLSLTEKSLIKRWISEGTIGLESNQDSRGEHWAFRPLNQSVQSEQCQSVQAPLSSHLTRMDWFLLSDLNKDNLSYLPEADPNTLLRRVSFDVTGLPPTLRQIEEFVQDQNTDAYSRMVDQMLSSPHFGERMGKLWLDASGYADSNGYFNADSDRPLGYRYRDYVIRSFNSDKSLTEFIREQLAGDQMSGITVQMGETLALPDQSSDWPNSAERVIELLEATHFVRNGQDGTGESDGNPDEVRVDRYTVIETAMQNISSCLLGLTIQCAKCHDHKFEPLTQRDYYRFQAVLIPSFPPEQWMKPNQRIVYACRQSEIDLWKTKLTEAEDSIKRLQLEINDWARVNRPRGTVVYTDDFESSTELQKTNWSQTAPSDDKPGGTSLVHFNTQEAPAANVVDGQLQIIADDGDGDKWLSTVKSFDWTPEQVGASIQVTFDLINDHVAESTVAARIGYFIAIHDFDKNSQRTRGNILIDGHPAEGSVVFLDYPGPSSKSLGKVGQTGYTPGRNYGIRITNIGEGNVELQHLVDWQVDEPSLKLDASDIPDGGFGFEYCCGRSFVVDNVFVETFSPKDNLNSREAFTTAINNRYRILNDATKTKKVLEQSQPGKISLTADFADPVPEVRVLERGNYAVPGETVQPSGFSILDDSVSDISPTSAIQMPGDHRKPSGRRLEFANWLTRPGSKPESLIARVYINRIWQHLFGVGLVASTENLGLSGSPPINRELLDWLAAEFIRSGGSTKHVIRLILNSAAYRQRSSSHSASRELPTSLSMEGSPLDHDGRRMSRYPIHRLDAEAIRDTLLVASGEFDDRLYGPYVPTTRTAEGETIVPEDQPGVRRRSLYLQQKRTQVHSLLQVFDAPSIVFNSTRRPRSTMPLQSLSLLNSEFVVARARHLAEQLERDFIHESDRLSRAFLLTTGRLPDNDEFSAATNFIEKQRQEYADRLDGITRVWIDLCHTLLIENTSLYLD